MGWGTKNLIANALSVGGTELFSSAVLLDPGEISHIQVVADSSGSTRSLIISVYTSLDSDFTNPDTEPIYSFTLDLTDGNEHDVSFVLSGIYAYKIGFVRDTGSDTITTNAWSREDGVNL